MRASVLVLACLVAWPVLAHDGHMHWDRQSAWTSDFWITVPLGLSALLYGVGIARLWHKAGFGRGVRAWQAACFASGWGLLVLALVSPLHWLGERLFTAHMVEHEILMALAAPLLVVARPVGAMLWALPPAGRQAVGGLGRVPVLARLWRWLTEPLVATILHGIALWIWHVPALYEAALRNPGIHWLQHLSFLVTAVLFWWALVRGRTRERGYGAAVLYLFATALHSGLLGILITMARQPLYPLQTKAAGDWGLTPLEDQQLAGLVMWVPAGLVYTVAALALAGLWIVHSGSTARRGGRHAVAASG